MLHEREQTGIVVAVVKSARAREKVDIYRAFLVFEKGSHSLLNTTGNDREYDRTFDSMFSNANSGLKFLSVGMILRPFIAYCGSICRRPFGLAVGPCSSRAISARAPIQGSSIGAGRFLLLPNPGERHAVLECTGGQTLWRKFAVQVSSMGRKGNALRLRSKHSVDCPSGPDRER